MAIALQGRVMVLADCVSPTARIPAESIAPVLAVIRDRVLRALAVEASEGANSKLSCHAFNFVVCSTVMSDSPAVGM